MNNMIQTMKRGHMSAVVLSLLQANNTVTTLEVKNELRRLYPEYSWLQKEVSDFMNEQHLTGELTYEDNGTYRVYSGEETKKATPAKKDNKGKVIPKLKAKRISKTKAFDLIMGNKGYFFTAEFVKQDGETRVINCQALKDQDPKLGYIKVREASLLRTVGKEKSIRNINIQTLKALKIGGVAYKVN